MEEYSGVTATVRYPRGPEGDGGSDGACEVSAAGGKRRPAPVGPVERRRVSRAGNLGRPPRPPFPLGPCGSGPGRSSLGAPPPGVSRPRRPLGAGGGGCEWRATGRARSRG